MGLDIVELHLSAEIGTFEVGGGSPNIDIPVYKGKIVNAKGLPSLPKISAGVGRVPNFKKFLLTQYSSVALQSFFKTKFKVSSFQENQVWQPSSTLKIRKTKM